MPGNSLRKVKNEKTTPQSGNGVKVMPGSRGMKGPHHSGRRKGR